VEIPYISKQRDKNRDIKEQINRSINSLLVPNGRYKSTKRYDVTFEKTVMLILMTTTSQEVTKVVKYLPMQILGPSPNGRYT
jgi:hypothetical protein